MLIQIASDLHLEFHNYDKQVEIIETLISPQHNEVEVLVLAGDILTTKCDYLIEDFCKRWKNIIYVPGNHEFTRTTIWEFEDLLSKKSTLYKNFYHLYPERGPVTINNQRFLGGTLWYPTNAMVSALASYWFDFNVIKNLTPEMTDNMNTWLIKALEKDLQSNDIVVTHMAPSFKSVMPIWQGSDTNCFFANNLDDLILAKQPKFWIHGHMHNPFSYKIENTKVICNPRGYEFKSNDGEGINFNPHLLIEV